MAEKLKDVNLNDAQILKSIFDNMGAYAIQKQKLNQQERMMDKAEMADMDKKAEDTSDEVNLFYGTYISQMNAGNYDAAELSLNLLKQNEYTDIPLPQPISEMQNNITSTRKQREQERYHLRVMKSGSSKEDIQMSHDWFESKGVGALTQTGSKELQDFYMSTQYSEGLIFSDLRSERSNKPAYNAKAFMGQYSSPANFRAMNPKLYKEHNDVAKEILGEYKKDENGKVILEDSQPIKNTQEDYDKYMKGNVLPNLTLSAFEEYIARGNNLEDAYNGFPEGSSYQKNQFVNIVRSVATAKVNLEFNPQGSLEQQNQQMSDLVDIEIGNLLGEKFKNDKEEKNVSNVVVSRNRTEITNRIQVLQREKAELEQGKGFVQNVRDRVGKTRTTKEQRLKEKDVKSKRILEIEAEIRKNNAELRKLVVRR